MQAKIRKKKKTKVKAKIHVFRYMNTKGSHDKNLNMLIAGSKAVTAKCD